MAEKTALVPIADGSEEIEAVTIIDTLRRAGINVFVASVLHKNITASRGVKIEADGLIGEVTAREFDVIAIPGGMPGATHLAGSAALTRLINDQHQAGRLVAAICAAPVIVLKPLGILDDRKATAHPGFSDQLADTSAVADRVVLDGHVITSRGPGTALEFALAVIGVLLGAEAAAKVAEPMLPLPGVRY